MTENYIVTNMKKIKVKYISDVPSVFFQKGEVYDGFLPEQQIKPGMIAFFFPEEEMDEPGYYALPKTRFEIVEE